MALPDLCDHNLMSTVHANVAMPYLSQIRYKIPLVFWFVVGILYIKTY
jgi:hypothetical protein